MADIILATLNAKYIHAAFGLRYLLANLGDLQSRACLAEFDINQRPADIAEALLALNPTILGLGIYIWNVDPTTELVAIIKRVRPDITIILGGPEVSYETESQPIAHLVDYVITGEADLKFAELCRELLAGQSRPSSARHSEQDVGRARLSSARHSVKIIPAELPDFSQLALPYDLYTEEDVAHRIIYVEASRGCPFTCEFCLSSLDIPVRQVPLPILLAHLQRLLDRGVRQFKFVDRTFNLSVNVSRTILEFFLERYRPGLFFHFEMIPDRLPEPLREIIAKFPSGALQFEVGIQTFNEEVGSLIKRRQNYQRLEENCRFLRNSTGVHIHADLIAGLPGENIESFAAGFDRLVDLGPQEIQVGILKRLRGTPIIRHDAEWQMVYNPHPPYEILQTKTIDFTTMQRLKRFARYWDLVGNSGNFVETTPMIWDAGRARLSTARRSDREQDPGRERLSSARRPEGHTSLSPFWSFMRWSEWLHERVRRTDSIALVHLMEHLFTFLTTELEHERDLVAEVMWRDYQRCGRRDKPRFLRDFRLPDAPTRLMPKDRFDIPKRQARWIA